MFVKRLQRYGNKSKYKTFFKNKCTNSDKSSLLSPYALGLLSTLYGMLVDCTEHLFQTFSQKNYPLEKLSTNSMVI